MVELRALLEDTIIDIAEVLHQDREGAVAHIDEVIKGTVMKVYHLGIVLEEAIEGIVMKVYHQNEVQIEAEIEKFMKGILMTVHIGALIEGEMRSIEKEVEAISTVHHQREV